MNRMYSKSIPLLGLDLLATPLNVQILRSLEREPMSLLELQQAVGLPPQSTMRLYSRCLDELGIIDRQRRPVFPSSTEYRITDVGKDLLGVAEVLEAWLNIAPSGPISLGTTASKSVTKALVEGWSTSTIRAIAARPLSLTELNQVISKISYPSLERRLGSMRLAGLVEPRPSKRRVTPYGATEWLRRAVIPVIAGAVWEGRHQPLGVQPISRLGAETVFLLVLPLLEMRPWFSGKFQLGVEVQSDSSPVLAGVLATFKEGAVVSCTSRLEGEVDTWISGPPDAWLRRMRGTAQAGLDLKGNLPMAEELLEALTMVGRLPSSADVDSE